MWYEGESMIKSKKKIVKTICYIFIISCLMYSFMTEKGAVRFSILLYGCPKEAITGHLRRDNVEHKDLEVRKQRAYIMEPYPIDKETGGILDRWIVKRYAIFYIAEFDPGI